MDTRTTNRGFTLVELLISMAVIALTLSVAVPSISNMVKDNRLAGQVNAVLTDIHMARSEATKRDTRIILCRSADPSLESPTCGGNEKDWSTGYIVFTGEDGDNTYEADTDTLLRRGQPSQSGIALRTTATWDNNLEINPSGSLNEGGTAVMAFCDSRGKAYGRQITLPLSGLPRITVANITDCSPT